MHVFLLTIIPLTYIVTQYFCYDRKIDREQIFCIFWGLVLACIYCLIDFFAVGTKHEWMNSVSLTWGHFLVTETILPVAVCCIPVFIAKDGWRTKVQFLFPVMAAFLVVFMPYKVITDGSSPDFFRMILYPGMIAAAVFNIDTAASLFAEESDLQKLMWLRCLIAFVVIISGIVFPSLFLAFYYLNQAGAGVYILIAVFILGSAGLRVVSKLFLS